mgnify:CR=1 FL=1
MPNCAIERTADAGHKACGASFAPKAHRFPRSAVGDVRRTVHRERYTLAERRNINTQPHLARMLHDHGLFMVSYKDRR